MDKTLTTTNRGMSLVELNQQVTVDRAFGKIAEPEEIHAAALVLREQPDTVVGLNLLKGYLDGGLSLVAYRAFPGQEGDNPACCAILTAAGHQEARELAGPNASLAVVLLAYRVVACKYHLAKVEAYYESERVAAAKSAAASALPHSRILTGAKKRDEDQPGKTLERAHRMYVGALKALADAQRLPLPTVQIATTAGVAVQVNAR